MRAGRPTVTFLFLVLASCAGSPRLDSHHWYVGASRVKITPDPGGWMTGYGSRKIPSDGVASDLWVRAVALRDRSGNTGVIVSAEILGFPPSLSRRLQADLLNDHGLRPAAVMLTATHTHAGPALPERPDPYIFHDFDEKATASVVAYAGFLKTQVLRAVEEAVADLEPARLHFGRGEAEYAMNRRSRQADGSYRIRDNPGGVVDRDVPVLSAHRADGSVKAVVFTYACHCTTLGGKFTKYHGDHAGAASAELERTHPGATALFVTGCAGDINPSPRGTVEQAVAHGKTLAREVNRILLDGRVVRLKADLYMKQREVRLPLLPAPPRRTFEALADDDNPYRARHARRMLQWMDDPGLPDHVPYPVLAWKLGTLKFVALSGEVTVEYALRIKEELGPERTWVAAYANEVACYIPSDKVLLEGGYEAGWNPDHGTTVAGGSMIYYGWPTPFAPGLEVRIVTAVKSLLP